MTKSFDSMLTKVLSEMQTAGTPTGTAGGPQGNQGNQPPASQNATKPSPSQPPATATHTDDDVINLVVKRLTNPDFKKKMEDAIKQTQQPQAQQKPPQQQNAQQTSPQSQQQTQQQNQSKP